MPIVEQYLASAKLSQHPFHALPPVPQLDLVLLNSHLDLQTNQFAIHRVRVLSNVKQAVGTDTQVLSRIRIESPVGQWSQMLQFLLEDRLSRSIPFGDHTANPLLVLRRAAEVAVAAQVQRLS